VKILKYDRIGRERLVVDRFEMGSINKKVGAIWGIG
jgi:hypothetical protein